MTYTVGSLFAGIGGLDLAFEWAGCKTLWQVEKDSFCRQVLAKNFPHATRHEDIFDCHALPYVDIVTAGFPCQPFSVAGKRQGVNDERYLVPEMLRVVSEVKPRVLLLENVPGFASLNDGAVFRELLRLLAEMGFDAEWGRIRASDVGAPHQRERWFCVAYRTNTGFDWRQRIKGNDAVSRESGNGFERSGGDGGGQTMAYAGSAGFSSGVVSGGDETAFPYLAISNQDVAYPKSERRIGRRKSQGSGTGAGKGKSAKRSRSSAKVARSGNASIPGTGQSQPRLGGNSHGLPSRLDRHHHRFPAAPGQAQFEYEPPRVSQATPNRTNRLKALGNAVVPQAAFPLALAIREWLEVQDSRKVAA